MDLPIEIPQAQPLAQYVSHREEIDAAIHRVLSAGRYILGEETQAFEREWAAYIGVRYAVGVGSGTEALTISLQACGIGPGDEVITTAHTAVATVAAIESVGARPVLVDVEQDTFLIDTTIVERALSPRSKAIIPVHLYGQPTDLERLLDIACRKGLRVIEDCAQAHGASYRGKRVGAWGELGCFSFYPTKNLGAIGDAGIVVTDHEDLADRMKCLREYGWRQRYVSEMAGINSRLDEIQAAILRVKLPHLDADNQRRIAIANAYSESLSRCVQIPVVKSDRTSTFHVYVIRTAHRTQLRRHLQERGVGTAIHYPVPIHLQPAYLGRLGLLGSFPVVERLAGEILSLPIYPEMRAAQRDAVIEAVQHYFAVTPPSRA